ncbi:MAG: hypothetical protein WC145_13165 [Aliarcobacter sp.]|jgi:hypothetical protein
MTPATDQSSDRLQYVGEVLGVAGAVLVALPSAASRAAGFAVWTVGNAAWISYGRRAGNRHIARLFSFYLLTAVVGLYSATMGIWT